MLYEFYLPSTDFGVADDVTKVEFTLDDRPAHTMLRDKIHFQISSIPWCLRKAVSWDDKEGPADVVLNHLVHTHSHDAPREFSGSCILQVDSSTISEEDATSTAWDICWILQLAFSKKIRWTQRGKRTDSGYEFVQTVATNPLVNGKSHAVLYNHANHVVKLYLESAYPIYIKNTDWWRVTFDWIAVASQSGDIEHVGLICSMLLDRISTFVLKDYKFPKQIDEELNAKLETKINDGELLRQEIESAISKLTPKWTSERTEALIRQIITWNDEPSYPKKIQAVFEKVGLPAPNGKVLQNRHKLAHGGQLVTGVDPVEYYKEITELVITLLLKMLNYSGKYYVLGVGEKHL